MACKSGLAFARKKGRFDHCGDSPKRGIRMGSSEASANLRQPAYT